MIEIDGLGSFEEQIAALEDAMANTRDVTAGLSSELEKANSALSGTSSGVQQSVERAVAKPVAGLRERDLRRREAVRRAVARLAASMVNSAFSAAIRPVSNQFGSLVSSGVQNLVASAMPFAAGGAFRSGRVSRLCRWRRRRRADDVPDAGRGRADGRGRGGGDPAAGPRGGRQAGRSRARGRGPVNVVFNIATPDVAGFQRSQSQLAAQMSRALARGQRNR